jgi:hypothetical protein
MNKIYDTLYLQGGQAFDIEVTTLPTRNQGTETYLFMFDYTVTMLSLLNVFSSKMK